MYVRLFQVYGSMVSKIYYHGILRPEEGMGIGHQKDDDLLRPDPYSNHKNILVPEPLLLPTPLLCRAHVVPIILGSVHEP